MIFLIEFSKWALEHFQEKFARFSARKMLKHKELEPIR